MAKQVTKRCHWVSQSYLKAFAADEAGQKIWRFSKNDGDPELKPIENVAVRFYLYAPMAADGTRDAPVERKLSELEQWFGEPIWKALCTSELDLTWEPLRKMLALIVATTYVRNPVQFETWKRIHRRSNTSRGWKACPPASPSAVSNIRSMRLNGRIFAMRARSE